MEEELINKVKHKDKNAFEQLIMPYHQSMYAVAKAFLRNDADTEDAIQETMYKAYAHIQSVKNPKSFRTWLFRILRNSCMDICRHNKKEIIPFDDLVIDKIKHCDMCENKGFFELIDFLDKDEKMLLILKYELDFKISEIAKISNLTESSVKMRLFRIRQKLAEQYNDKK